MKHQKAYEEKNIIANYSSLDFLFEPEKKVFQTIPKQTYKILDLGVGAGRTSKFLIPISSQYIGIDLSTGMINICKERFNASSHATFLELDACVIESYFEKESFDFVCFSFNGIDCLSFEQRDNLLTQVHKLLKKNGFFFFSTHNILCVHRLRKLRLGKNIFKWWGRFKVAQKIKKLNPHLANIKNLNTTRIVDGAEDFNLSIAYVNPVFQLEVLDSVGFKKIFAYDFKSGNVLKPEELKHHSDYWIYFLCQK